MYSDVIDSMKKYSFWYKVVFFNNVIFVIQMFVTINTPIVQAPFGVSCYILLWLSRAIIRIGIKIEFEKKVAKGINFSDTQQRCSVIL
jgi:hypothetical protein